MAVTNKHLVRALVEDPWRLAEVWQEFLEAKNKSSVLVGNGAISRGCGCATCRASQKRALAQASAGIFATFARAVFLATSESIGMCVRCDRPEWDEKCFSDRNDKVVCHNCRENYRSCASCDSFDVEDPGLTWVAARDNRYCQGCVDENYSWCSECDEYYDNDDASEHNHEVPCGCTPQPLAFEIPANSHGTLAQDERLLVELPEGFITDEAMGAVVDLLWQEQFDAMIPQADYYSGDREAYYQSATERATLREKLRTTVESLERNWQTRRGNFTRRLSKALHDEMQAKLDPGLLSKVGSTVRAHTSKANQWYVEFTRDLNQSDAAFANQGSCWWGSESEGLCALKSWGGLAMRSYESEEQEREFPSGRAWIQPLNEDMRPTNDILGAHAYVVYNGYGDMEGYTAVRLVAYLASRTYRKINFAASYQYVNSCSGYLVADQETCNKYGDISIHDLSHHQKVSA